MKDKLKEELKIYSSKLTWHDPEEVFLNLFSNKTNTFWLDNNFSKTGYSYMGQATELIQYTLSNHTLRISNNNKTQILHQDIFSYLSTVIPACPESYLSCHSNHSLCHSHSSCHSRESGNPEHKNETPPFIGGFIGYFGYEVQTTPPSTSPKSAPTHPDACFFYIDTFLAFNHHTKELHLISHSKPHPSTLHTLSTQIRNLKTKTKTKKTHTKNIKLTSNKSITFTMSRSRSQYLKDIQTCQDYLAQGHAYQICLTNQITANISTNWLNLYRTLRRENPAPFSAYLNFGNFALLSSSPEQFLKINQQGIITTKPMKGTIKRGKTPEEDQALKNQLGKTTKDYAENIMIVDLLRNDLGRVCEIGSVKVINPLTVETYATLHTLTSTVTGKLRPNLSTINAIQSTFPGGSMTGAPKIRAMQILAELEKKPRGIYSGTFGYLSLNGETNLAMTIRTIIATPKKLSFGTGGAILADSIPLDEYNEMLLKAKALIKSIQNVAGT